MDYPQPDLQVGSDDLGSLSHSRSPDCFLGRCLGDHDCGSDQDTCQIAGHDHELATHLVSFSCAAIVSCGLFVPRGNVPVYPLIATRTPESLIAFRDSGRVCASAFCLIRSCMGGWGRMPQATGAWPASSSVASLRSATDTRLISSLPDSRKAIQYQRNQQVLRENAQAYGRDRRHGPPGEGPALLQGMVLCGLCGQRMTVCYHLRKVGLVPNYRCQKEGIEHVERICQNISGLGIDEAVGGLLLEILTPWTLEVALAVQEELQQRLAEADQLRRQHLQRARYDADLARERFMQVDPKNRLVADTLEANWNERLRALTEAQEQHERQRQADRAVLDQESRSRILALAADFPRLWKDPKTPDRERKRMARLLIEDVTLIKGEQLTIQVRFKGGAVRTLISPLPQPSWMIWQTNREVIAEVDRLLDDHTDGRIAAMLNERGWHPGKGGMFTKDIITWIRDHYRLRSRFDRLREAGMLTQVEIANQLGVTQSTVHKWRQSGLLKAHAYNDKPGYVYEPVGTNAPHKQQGIKRTDLPRFPTASTEKTKEVQDEA